MRCSGSIDFAPSARNSQKPWMEQTWTVAFGDGFDDDLPKQSKHERNGDWINKNFRISWRIGRV